GDFDWAGKRYRGIHQPLISKELWDKVQEVMAGKGKRNTHRQKHDWAFHGLVSCGHCGSAMVAEIKKGKYVYYHCTGYKGKCPEKYVREEELDRQFGEALKAISLDDDVVRWIVAALKESRKDEKAYHERAVSTLQSRYQKLQDRIDAMYIDKLDGRISQEMYDKKSEEWKHEQFDIVRRIESHQKANHNYIDSGVRTLELAQKAYSLYEKQNLAEKRSLLNFLLSNSVWRNGRLIPSYKKPFDLIVEAKQQAVDNSEDPGPGFDETAKNEIWRRG
ncbi:MAG: recombinase zinc ribbon domain-containing protein, partial [Armatimonadota bacterium]